jgi:Tfp pilus assembly protein FimV
LPYALLRRLLLQAEAGEVRRMLEEASAQVAQQAAALSSMGEETDSKAAELAAAQVRRWN